jgi:hypothetical protein
MLFGPRTLLSLLLLATCFGLTALVDPAHAEKRVALVIGNAAYRGAPLLTNPTNDAVDVAASLERLGFSVTRLNNATFDAMRRGLLDFNRVARVADMAVVFYAGHGMEVGGENWLMPTDAEFKTDSDAEHEAIALRNVMATVDGASKLGLVLLDACRNNPFAARIQRTTRTRSVDRGLARVEPAGNMLVVYAAKDGTTAIDGEGRNSPFTAAVLKHLETPGLEIQFLFRNVRDEVMSVTKNAQQPFVYGSLSKDAIYLKAQTTALAVPPAVSAAPEPASLAEPKGAPAPSATKLQARIFLQHFVQWGPNCSGSSPPPVNVTTPPKYGKVVFVRESRVVTQPGKTTSCVGKTLPGLVAYYVIDRTFETPPLTDSVRLFVDPTTIRNPYYVNLRIDLVNKTSLVER